MSKRVKIVVAFWVVVILVAIVIFNLLQGSQFQLTRSTPKLGGKVATSTSTIKLDFNDSIDPAQDYASQMGGDTQIIKKVSVEGKSILIKLAPLDKNIAYDLRLNGVKSLSGKVIAEVPIRFTAVYIPYDELSDEQKNLELSETDKITPEDPILAILPYEGDRFLLTSEYTANDAGETILVIDTQLLLTRADLGANRETAIAQYKKRALDYIVSKGFDPAKYLIRYDINEPPSI